MVWGFFFLALNLLVPLFISSKPVIFISNVLLFVIGIISVVATGAASSFGKSFIATLIAAAFLFASWQLSWIGDNLESNKTPTLNLRELNLDDLQQALSSRIRKIRQVIVEMIHREKMAVEREDEI